jgi:alanyl-tRNA synthetase
MKSSEVRNKFLKYFEKQKHSIQPSSRLIPDGDPTILFTNAGMNQFKNLFLGLEQRDYARATTSQKCVRAGGKHNDLENVGFTARHHTFFEMLGNFSFGDYFKKEAIHFAWELITKEFGLPKDRLYVSVFETDDEAADIWHKQEGVPRERIYRFGEKDNFWRMGNSGPCGPCSEIFFSMDPDYKGVPPISEIGNDKFIEFWNLVFMQYNESEDGKKTLLPKPSVDTGMGLERMATILQGKRSNYDNDLFQTLIARAEKVSGVSYVRDAKALSSAKDKEREQLEKTNVAMRVLADHARATAFLIADGVLPSNDGRGYVLRRIMRRAIRYGHNLHETSSILPAVVEAVIEEMSTAYPELKKQSSLILTHTRDEEKRFTQTLAQGTSILTDQLSKLSASGSKIVDGKTAFKLYDTFGFPLDLTQLMAKEKGFEVDQASFDQHFEQAREVAKSSWKAKGYSVGQAHLIKLTQDVKKAHGPTRFDGYSGVVTSNDGKIVAISNGNDSAKELKKDDTGLVILDRTCFYAESGGQVGDTGLLITSDGQAEVLDCTKQNEIHVLHVRVTDGFIGAGACQQQVNVQARRNTANNHSATHLLHAALRKVLGSHITQAGSLVGPDKLRFDFTHNKPVAPEEIEAIENLVNQQINVAIQVETNVMTPDAAVKAGALALFGEKYGDEVRVLRMGEFSMELCGGTHVDNTASIRLFKIVSEAGVSSGVRRMEAITGEVAARYFMKNTLENLKARSVANIRENWLAYMNSEVAEVDQFIERLREEKKQLEKQIQSLKGSKISVDDLVGKAQKFSVGGLAGQLVFADLETDDRDLLGQIGDKIRDKIQSGVVILVGRGDGSHPIMVNVTKNLVGPLNAGKILGEVASALGGKGGGRPDFAQGAGKDLSNMAGAKAKASALVGA